MNKKADYVLGVKKNQPALYNDCKLYFEKLLLQESKLPAKADMFETVDAAENMGVLRRLALSICKRYTADDTTSRKLSNPKKLKKAAWEDSFREKLLFGKAL